MTAGIAKVLEAAMAAHRRGDEAAASAGYRDVLASQSENADALHLLGVITARSAPSEGIALIERALAVNPTSFEAHLNLANLLAGQLRMAEAELHFREAHKANPAHLAAINGLGGALLHLGRYTEAEPFLREALNRDATSAAALLNMAMLMDATDRVDQALQFYDRLFAAHPEHSEGHQHQGLALLLRGDFAPGWAKYASRVKCVPTFHGQFKFPYWRGEPVAGRKILVWTEQGPGDEILVATMIPDLVAMGAEVILLCSPRMAPLFARSFPTITVVAAGQKPRDPAALEGIEFQASIGELGAALRPSFGAFTTSGAPLKADPGRTSELRRRYKGSEDKLLVGISWRSKNAKLEDAKTVPLQQWGPILTCTGVTFVSLQYGAVDAEVDDARQTFGVNILVDREVNPLANLDDFAAQVAAMDIVISVSNTTVHMAGALGREIWVLVPTNHGRLWYWFLERSNSPWYPSARLFRQDPEAGWQPVLASIGGQLADRKGRGGELATHSPTS